MAVDSSPKLSFLGGELLRFRLRDDDLVMGLDTPASFIGDDRAEFMAEEGAAPIEAGNSIPFSVGGIG